MTGKPEPESEPDPEPAPPPDETPSDPPEPGGSPPAGHGADIIPPDAGPMLQPGGLLALNSGAGAHQAASEPTPAILRRTPGDGGGETATAVQMWNTLAEELDLPKAQKITASRRASLKSRLKDCGGLEGWQAALDKIRTSPGLQGKNDRGWKMDFDDLTNERKFTRLMEGKYDRWGKSGSGSDDPFRDAFAELRADIAAGNDDDQHCDT